MEGRFSSGVSPGELAVVAAVLLIVCIGVAVFARRKAPAASVALAAAVIAGVIGFFPSSLDGPQRVPQDVVVWASCALLLFGLFGLIFLRGSGPAPTWRAVLATVVCAPALGTLVHFAVTHACPLYVGRGSGYCHYSVDVMGGWATTVSVLVALDTLCVAFLFGVTGWQARPSVGSPMG